MNNEETDRTAEAAELHAVNSLVDIVGTISNVMEQSQTMTEVQNALLVRLGEAVMAIQMRLGLMDQAGKLAGAYALAASVMRANANNEKEEE